MLFVHLPACRTARRAACLAALVCALALPLAEMAHPSQVQAAPATPIIVNNLSESIVAGKCRLRDAMTAANTNVSLNGCATGSPGADTIIIDPPIICRIAACSILLSSTLPPVVEDLTIEGAHIPIDGNNAFLILDLRGVVVTLNHLTLTHGKGTSGGAIDMNGTTLTLNDVTVSNHAAQSGAGIHQFNGALFVNS
jgi:hypothetical protein